jgi:hypothetical protein
LTAKEFQSERFVVWQASLAEKNDKLFITAADDEAKIHSGTVHFPPQIIWNRMGASTARVLFAAYGVTI